ncbi:hypothetical protein [Halococcus agarilyticus]|uniref:hypothetical protein n=1 Tax=Halococcus agarilyticus TaxID=1232219 RepID=UPI000677A7D1|nr:hypothetical protein [Halococcus agarilyticus]
MKQYVTLEDRAAYLGVYSGVVALLLVPATVLPIRLSRGAFCGACVVSVLSFVTSYLAFLKQIT